MTELEVKAHILGQTMLESGKYGKDEGTKACSLCIKLAVAGKASEEDVSRASGWLGNHSAVRQWGEKMGFVKKTDAERDALARALDKILGEVTDPANLALTAKKTK